MSPARRFLISEQSFRLMMTIIANSCFQSILSRAIFACALLPSFVSSLHTKQLHFFFPCSIFAGTPPSPPPWRLNRAPPFSKTYAFNRSTQSDLRHIGRHANCATCRRRQTVNQNEMTPVRTQTKCFHAFSSPGRHMERH